MSIVDQWISQGTGEQVEVQVCFNRSLLGEFETTLRAYQAAEANRKLAPKPQMLNEEREDEQIARRLTELHEAVKADEAAHTFVFRKMPYRRFRAIIERFPPSDAQKAANPFADHDGDRAAPLLVACSCVDPAMEVVYDDNDMPATSPEAEKLRDFLPEGPWAELYMAAVRVNRTGVAIPKAVSSTVGRLASELNSTSAPAPASPSRSSADG